MLDRWYLLELFLLISSKSLCLKHVNIYVFSCTLVSWKPCLLAVHELTSQAKYLLMGKW